MSGSNGSFKRHTEPPILSSTVEEVVITPADFAMIFKRAELPLKHDDVTKMATTGISNILYGLGNNYVLRVARNHPNAYADARTESVAVPVVTAHNIKTPRLIAYDDSETILPVPYTIYERVHGQTLLEYSGDPASRARIYREFGAEIARLHQQVTTCPDPKGFLDRPYRIDAMQLIEALTESGYLSTDNRQWLTTVFKRLLPAVEEASSFRRFLHDDAHMGNIMVTNDAFGWLLDWGDAGWGDPAMEFTYTPSRAIPYVLEGYRSIMLMDGDDTAEARILWDHLARALARLKRDPVPQRSMWSDRPGAPLVELLAAISTVKEWQQYLS